MIELTIKLETEAIEDAIRKVWAKEFQQPEYYGRSDNATGWNAVKRQVAEHIATMDLSDMIARAAKARIDDVVNEVVTIALREKAKQRVKEMTRDGTLL